MASRKASKSALSWGSVPHPETGGVRSRGQRPRAYLSGVYVVDWPSPDERNVMYVLNFWHTVPDYAAWKRVFDGDPLDRAGSGVRHYTIAQPVDDERTIIGELEFATLDEVYTFAGRLRELWASLGSDVLADAQMRITKVLEAKRLSGEAERRAA
jgi:hypothetical protein